MSLARRIIPCLDTDGERVVKGVNFVALRDAGDPVALAARYNAEGADELVVLDIAASRDRRPTFLETIRRVAAELSIPLTAGGGIRTLDDARAVVRAGADKITVNTAAVLRPELISELSAEFGSQAVVLAIDAKGNGAGWTVTVRGGRELTTLDAGRVGRAGSRTWRGRNPADFGRPRRNSERFRHSTYGGNFRERFRSSDRLRRSEGAGTFCGDFSRWIGRCGACSFHFPRRCSVHPRVEDISRQPRYSGAFTVLIPCIDLQGGQAVQLVHGRKRELAVADVFGLLAKFKEYEWLHVIDLDAAMGKTPNANLVKKLCWSARTSYGMKVRVGGGIRTVAQAVRVASWGAEQIIIGSAAFRDGKLNLPFLKRLAGKTGSFQNRDRAGHGEGPHHDSRLAPHAQIARRRGDAGIRAVLRGVLVHGCRSRRHPDRRELEMV